MEDEAPVLAMIPVEKIYLREFYFFYESKYHFDVYLCIYS